MKKTLLCFIFLLLTNIFYAQISDIEHCAFDTSFDLTAKKTALLGNLNPAETTISYHLSANDAESNINAIANPTEYASSQSSTTIYARIDNKGTVTTNYFNLILNKEITAKAIIIKNIDCISNGSISVSASGGKGSYQYSINQTSNFTKDNTFTNLAQGNYIIYVKDELGCIEETNAVFLTQPVLLTATVDATKIMDCSSNPYSFVTVNVSGGYFPYKYSLDKRGFENNNVFYNVYAGSHIIEVKDAAGCSFSTIITIESPSSLTASTVLTEGSKCGDTDSVKIIASGGQAPYKYSFDGGTTFSTNDTSANLTAQTHSLIVKDNNGCLASSYVTINQYKSTLVSYAMIYSISCITNEGAIVVYGSRGKAPYQYSLNGAAYTSNNTFSNLVPGSYLVNTKDDSGCITSLNVTIAPESTLIVDVLSNNISCFGSNDGSIEVNVSGGNLPYSYSLLDSSGVLLLNSKEVNTFTGLEAGIYIIHVTDGGGCTISKEVYVLQPASPIISTISVENQTITINAEGGTGKIMYAISPNLNNFNTSNTFTNLQPGTYSVIAKDQNGCLIEMQAVINVPSPLINGKNEIVFKFKQGQTLADIVVEGQNIKWYNNKTNSAAKPSKTSESILPLTTVLVDGATYYASQTINGTESVERLAVTAKLSGSLSTPDFDLPDFKYFPNPVQRTLTISNPANIDQIEVISVSGKLVLSKKLNNMHSEIDLSGISSGLYFLKVKSQGQTKTIKIIKK